MPCPGAAAGQGAAHARRGRRRVRRAGGPVDARARLPARAAHWQAGEDVLQPRGVVLRPRPPAPGPAALRARLPPRRRPRLRAGQDLARRRRLRLEQLGGRRERGADGHRSLRGPERDDGLLGRLHEQPPVRRHARVRRRAGSVRLRVADGQGCCGARPGPGRAAGAQRDGGGLGRADGAGRRQCGAGRRAAAEAAGDADAAAGRRCRRVRERRRRPAGDAGRRVEHDARRGRAARRRAGRSATRTSRSARGSTTTRPRGSGSR